MSPRHDDDALSWEGDDDPTLQVDAAAERESVPAALPEGFTAVGKGSDEVGRIEADGTIVMPGEPAPMGNAALLGLGVLGGIYLLYVIGWIIGGVRLHGTAQFLVSPVIYQAALWLAVLAPILWFGTTYLLTRESRAWLRFVWLIAGAILLVPWPFIMTGVVGQ